MLPPNASVGTPEVAADVYLPNTQSTFLSGGVRLSWLLPALILIVNRASPMFGEHPPFKCHPFKVILLRKMQKEPYQTANSIKVVVCADVQHIDQQELT